MESLNFINKFQKKYFFLIIQFFLYQILILILDYIG